jgi:hypothetical protein
MDLLTVILACSLHPDDRLVEAFARKVSDANPLFVGDFVSLATHDDLASPEQALELARSIAEKGGRPALGLMAIPMTWAARFNREPADLLDACTNISIGTAMMASFAADCAGSRHHAKTRGGRARRLSRRKLESMRVCVLEGFDREVGVRGFTQIVAEIPRLPARDLDADLPPERSSVFERETPTPRPQAPIDPFAPTAPEQQRGMPGPPRSPQSTARPAPSPSPAPGGIGASNRRATPPATDSPPLVTGARTAASQSKHLGPLSVPLPLPMAAARARP